MPINFVININNIFEFYYKFDHLFRNCELLNSAVQMALIIIVV